MHVKIFPSAGLWLAGEIEISSNVSSSIQVILPLWDHLGKQGRDQL